MLPDLVRPMLSPLAIFMPEVLKLLLPNAIHSAPASRPGRSFAVSTGFMPTPPCRYANLSGTSGGTLIWALRYAGLLSMPGLGAPSRWQGLLPSSLGAIPTRSASSTCSFSPLPAMARKQPHLLIICWPSLLLPSPLASPPTMDIPPIPLLSWWLPSAVANQEPTSSGGNLCCSGASSPSTL